MNDYQVNFGLSSGQFSTSPGLRTIRQNPEVSIGSSSFILCSFFARPLASHRIFLSFDSLGGTGFRHSDRVRHNWKAIMIDDVGVALPLSRFPLAGERK
jgi:hypothetical protein